jgi:DNA-binding response OmpR family regulator
MPAIHVLEHTLFHEESLTATLQRRGFDVQRFKTAHDFFYQLAKRPPRCLVVDWMFNDIGGLEIVQRTREVLGPHIGIVVVTPEPCEESAMAAFRTGCDDCMPRPVRGALLAVRVEALLRRVTGSPTAQAKRIQIGPYELDMALRTVSVDGCDAGLSPREFDLAWLLFSQPSRLLTREELLALLWGRGAHAGAHTITQHVYALRKKLAFDTHGIALQSVYGTGYRLERIEHAPVRRATVARSGSSVTASL